MKDILNRFLVIILTFSILLGPESLLAANYQWIQTDWSGGQDPFGTTGHVPAQNGQSQWNKYYTKDPNVDPLSTPGQISISPNSGSWNQDTDIDFNSGMLTNLQVIGTGTFSTLKLKDYVLDLGSGLDGSLTVDGVNGANSTDGRVHNAANPWIINGVPNYTNVTVQNGGVISAPTAAILSSPANVTVTGSGSPYNNVYTYYYVVTAVDRYGFETPRSPLNDGNTNSTLGKTDHSIAWSAVPGASFYRVYRQIVTYPAGPAGYPSPALVCTTTTTSCAVTVSTVAQTGAPHLKTTSLAISSATVSSTGGMLTDGTYYYVLTAIDAWGYETTPSSMRTVTIATGTGTSSVALSWSSVNEAAGYRIYRSSLAGIFNDPSLVCATTTLSCTDTLPALSSGAPPRSYDHPLSGGELRLKMSGTLFVDSTSSIQFSGGGFPGGVDTLASVTEGVPGKGPGGAGKRGGGGGYGSSGTNNSSGALYPGEIGYPYGDSPMTVIYPGSGGASGSSNTVSTGGVGGNGGGSIRISAQAFDVRGTISANGNSGNNGSGNGSDGGGGGSGGSLFLDGNTFSLSGQITATGGGGGSKGTTNQYYLTAGSGGNGRIRISTKFPITGAGVTNPVSFQGDEGVYVSSSKDLGVGGVSFSAWSWSGTNNGGSLKFLISTNNDNRTWVFRGPDGTREDSGSPTYYTTSGTPIWSGHNGDRYVKYKVIFASPDIDPAHGPILDNVTLSYVFNPSFQVLTSSPYDSLDPTNTLRRLKWDENLPTGTSARMQIRTGSDQAALLTSNWYGPWDTTTTVATGNIPVQDPGFESCTQNGANPPGWSVVRGTYGTGGCRTGGHTGGWALSLNNGAYAYQTLALTAGVPYTFSVWAKVDATPPSATLMVSSVAGGGTVYCSNSTGATAWTQISCQYTPTSDLTVTVNLNAGDYLSRYSWFDDLVVSIPVGSVTSLFLSDASGFTVGEGVTLTDGSNPSQVEFRRVAAVDAIQNKVTLDAPLTGAYTAGSVLTDAYADPAGTETVRAGHRDGAGDQWFQYRVLLSAEDRLRTPVFLESRLGYLPLSGIYQPDGVIDGIGDNVYGGGGSGGGGASTRTVDPAFKNGQAAYPLQIQNDGTSLDTYTITWNTPSDLSGSWTAVLSDGVADLPSPVSLDLNAGMVRNYTLKLTPSAYAPADSVQNVILNIRSENEYAKVDSIKATATVNRIYQADGILDGNGNDIFDSTGAGNGGSASKTAVPGDTMTFLLTVQNDGNIQDTYTLSQSSSCMDNINHIVKALPPKWKIFLNDGATDHDITSSSWTTALFPATVNAGAITQTQYTLKVFPLGEPISCDTVLKITSAGTGSILDSVRATTVLSPTRKVDLWIQNNGDNLFGGLGSGAGGSYSEGIAGGATGTFDLRVQNEGNVPDSFELNWTAPAGWSTAIVHQDGTVLCVSAPCSVPPSDKVCPYFNDANGNGLFDADVDQCLAIAGEVIPLKFQVTPPSSFTSGEQLFYIDGKSKGDFTQVDSVRARVMANVLNAPTIMIDSSVSKTATSIPLTWTTLSWPTGIGLYYDLRYSTKRIVDDGLTPVSGEINFSNATPVTGLSAPQSAGKAEKVVVNHLYAGTTYHFALKVKSATNMTSLISSCLNCPASTLVSSDATPPPAVTDLTKTAATADSVTLCWTAPSDDNANTPVTGYFLRYSTKNIVDDGIVPGVGEIAFSGAALSPETGTPKSPGSRECYAVGVKNIVSGNDRTPNTQFFFTLKSEDENHNLSPISNVAPGLSALSPNTYNMVSIPRVPIPNTPADVFGDDVGSPLYLYRWDSRGIGHDRGCYNGLPTPYNLNNEICAAISSIPEGRGYFLWSPRMDIVLDAPAGSLNVPTTSCTDEAGLPFTCYIYPLQDGWNMIGNPFGKEVNFGAIKVRQTKLQGGNTVITTVPFLDSATSRNWMGNAIYSYNGVQYTYEFCDQTGCAPVLQPWKSYWIWLHRQGDGGGSTAYDLLIPSP